MATLLVSLSVAAEPTSTTTTGTTPNPNQAALTGRRIAVDTPVEAFTPSPTAATISPTIYLERCKGGCVVNGGSLNDARTMTSTIPNPGQYNVSEFKNAAGQIGTAADAEWNMFVTCMREVYSPYMVTVTDVKPASGVSYHLALVAGTPPEVGLDNGILGVAPLASNCGAFDNVISFSFANAHSQTDPLDRTLNLCWTAAQESAHAFGLDHEYAFLSDNRSACNDPMTYRTDCGGQKFFRNEAASCGEFDGPRQCRCGASQNSHLKILSVFGAGTPITGVPTVAVTTPPASSTGANTLPANVIAQASDKRGIAKVELYLNGYKWAEAKGAPFGANGQPDSAYGLLVPSTVPDSVYDVMARAYDDLGAYTDSAVITVTKGAEGGCTSASSCLTGQKCEAGKCFWDAPTGQLGDACTYPQFCVSGQCSNSTFAGDGVCTQTCVPGMADSCPADSGLSCVATGQPGQGLCVPADEGGGCCSTSDTTTPWPQIGMAGFVLGLVVLRRRRRG
ncbi:MAG TPA: Ig-like domain-containing protein [Kofleriaceae bacterium]|nr:Ig-like domain-containing protein [Kofleriaceae bacterium]